MMNKKRNLFQVFALAIKARRKILMPVFVLTSICIFLQSCPSPSCTYSIEMVIPPSNDIILNTGPITISEGQAIKFDPRYSDLCFNIKWTSIGGSPSTSTESNPTITYNTPGTFLVSINVEGDDGTNNNKTVDVIVLPLPACASPITDIDGNQYMTLDVGGNCWMAENLRTTKYQNGDAITTGLDSTGWVDATSGAYAHVGNDPSNSATYGNLYSGHAIFDSRGICPVGWHPATQTNWDDLIASQGGDALAGGALRTTTGWLDPNTGATNSSGFSALPAGFLTTSPFGYSFGMNQAYFWVATTTTPNTAPFVLVHNGSADLFIYDSGYTDAGMSCRCVKD